MVLIYALVPQLEVRRLHLLCCFGAGLFGHVLSYLLISHGRFLDMVGILLSLAPNLTVGTIS
jgi:apolipoprotein N-acyltransferase